MRFAKCAAFVFALLLVISFSTGTAKGYCSYWEPIDLGAIDDNVPNGAHYCYGDGYPGDYVTGYSDYGDLGNYSTYIERFQGYPQFTCLIGQPDSQWVCRCPCLVTTAPERDLRSYMNIVLADDKAWDRAKRRITVPKRR